MFRVVKVVGIIALLTCIASASIASPKISINSNYVTASGHRFYINKNKFKNDLAEVILHQTDNAKDFTTTGMVIGKNHVYKYELINENGIIYLNLYEFYGSNIKLNLPVKEEIYFKLTLDEAKKLNHSNTI